MKKKKYFFGIVILFMAANVHAGEFRVTGPTLQVDKHLANRHVLNGFGCTGENISPELSWQGEPATTKSFAITVYDPDAPTGSGWWHWLVFNIPKEVHHLAEGSGTPGTTLLPTEAVEGRTDFGSTGYGGACPPAGNPDHRYQFTVWALDTDKLPLTSDSSGAMIGFYLNGHMLDKAELTVTYGR